MDFPVEIATLDLTGVQFAEKGVPKVKVLLQVIDLEEGRGIRIMFALSQSCYYPSVRGQIWPQSRGLFIENVYRMP
jgi:hypothetical protein